MSRHSNIAIFVPHIGCKNRCSFCDQNAITGCTQIPTPTDVAAAVETAIRSPRFNAKNTEIAFFGGSFTAIDFELRESLLQAAFPFVQNGTVRGIRVSTRPDAITKPILEQLKVYGVTAIELGAQSLDDTVLVMNHRGHTAKDVETACRLIKEGGFELGLQMMTGLYGDSRETALETARKIIALNPDTVRIYPTVVLQNTHLAQLVGQGVYQPQSLTEAVDLCADLLERFQNAGIAVIRLGLHSIDENRFVAGPWHPAFSELCYAKRYLQIALSVLKEPGDYLLYVCPADVSQMIGQKRKNLEILREYGFNCQIKTDARLLKYEIRTERQ